MANWLHKAVLAENYRVNGDQKKSALASLPVAPWNGYLYHGSPLDGMIDIVRYGLHPVPHNELGSELLSVSINDNVLHLFSDGEGNCGFAFDAKFDKVLVIDDFHYALAAWQSGGDFWADVLAQNPEAEQMAEALGYKVHGGDYGMWEGELTDNLPPGTDAIILPGFDSRHHNAEAEMGVTELGCSKLMNFIDYVYVRGEEYGKEEGLKLLNDVKILADQGVPLDEALEQAKGEG